MMTSMRAASGGDVSPASSTNQGQAGDEPQRGGVDVNNNEDYLQAAYHAQNTSEWAFREAMSEKESNEVTATKRLYVVEERVEEMNSAGPVAAPMKGSSRRILADDPDEPAALPSRSQHLTTGVDRQSVENKHKEQEQPASRTQASFVRVLGDVEKPEDPRRDALQQLKEDLKTKKALQQEREDLKAKNEFKKTSALSKKVVVGAVSARSSHCNIDVRTVAKSTADRCQRAQESLVEDQAVSLSDQKQVWHNRRLSLDDQQRSDEYETNLGDNDRDNGNGTKRKYVNGTPGAYPIAGFGITIDEGSDRAFADDIEFPSTLQVPSSQLTDSVSEREPQGGEAMEEGQLAIAARVVERTDDEIEDAVRQRLLSEAVKAVAVKVIPDQDPRKARRRRYCTAVVVVLGAAIIIIVISVAVTMKKQSDNKVNDGRPTIAVAFQFDQFAEETGWNLTCTSGKNSSEIALNVTVPQGAYNVSFVYVVSEPIAVDYGYECQLRVSDLFGDGFCCRHGDGYYQVVLLLGDVVLVQESGEFGSETVVNFTVTAPSPGEETNDNSTSIPNNSTSPPLWTQVGADVNGQKAGDKLGSSVSLATWNNSIIVAIGAPGEVSGDSPVGYVKVLLYNTSDTRQLGQVIFGDSFDLQTGSSVSLSVNGTVLAVGAPAAGADNEIPGSVIVYQYDEAKDWWSFKGSKISGDGSANDGFGTSAAISGDATTVVVGAPFSNSPDGKVDIGRIQVYTFNDTSSEWIQLGQDIVGTTKGDQFGFSVSISNDGRTVAAGAPSSGAERPGYSVVYKYSSLLGDWLRIGNINMGTEVGDESGTCVCLSGNGTRLAVGSPHITNGTAGYVRVLEYNSKHWEQVGRDLVDISGGAAESVSLSADGLTVAFGARTANSTGRVRVFRQENLTCVYPFCWDQVGENIVGDTSGALFGDSVSLSRDGSVIAVGSPFADEASGAVRVMMNTTN